MQEFQFPMAFHTPEFLRGVQQPAGHPAQGLFSFSPAFQVVRYPLDGRETRFDWIRRGPRSEQHGAHAQPMHRKHFLEPFFQVPWRANTCQSGDTTPFWLLPKPLSACRCRTWPAWSRDCWLASIRSLNPRGVRPRKLAFALSLLSSM